MWKELNKIMGRKNTTTEPLIKLPEGVTMNHSDYINNYFNDTVKLLKQNQTINGANNFRRYLNPPTNFSLRLNKVSEDDVLKYIKENKSNAAGYDGIDPKIVKFTADIIKKPLTYVINQSLKTGIFPERLKVAKIIPLHKKGDKTNVENKRPISILNAFSKVFEKSIYEILSNYLEKKSAFDTIPVWF